MPYATTEAFHGLFQMPYPISGIFATSAPPRIKIDRFPSNRPSAITTVEYTDANQENVIDALSSPRKYRKNAVTPEAITA